MPRKDRTFSQKDVIRIICNNLDGKEFDDVVRSIKSGNFCADVAIPEDTPSPCDVLAEIIDVILKSAEGTIEQIKDIVDIINEILLVLRILEEFPPISTIVISLSETIKGIRTTLIIVMELLRLINTSIVRFLRTVCD